MTHLLPEQPCPDEDGPETSTQVVAEPSGLALRYVLPLGWSLSYALTKTQWKGLRERHKTVYPGYRHCSCPKLCKANTLDEQWEYDETTHTKILLGTKFICSGCHWIKSITWRIETWNKQRNNKLPALTKPPHIIDCLGWTEQQVDMLRDKDLARNQVESMRRADIVLEVEQGKAAIAPAPIERLSHGELSTIAKPDQVIVTPWRVDLTILAKYGYSPEEIATFAQRMYALAARRMGWSEKVLAEINVIP